MFRELDPERIVKTVQRLQQRVLERFPDSSLGEVASELHSLSKEALSRIRLIRSPIFLIRLGVSVALLLGIGIAAYSFFQLEFTPFSKVRDFVNFAEAALGCAVFLGAAILFLLSLEQRFKRHRTLRALHELRALAHIVDMHQLTKDPERILRPGRDTPSSPERSLSPFELQRYLDYCSEMLALISKVGALYVQGFPDRVALSGADQVESLTTGLSRKVWQKMSVLDRYEEASES